MDAPMFPHNAEAEEALIGSVIIHPAAYWQVAGDVQASDFYIERNRWMWEAVTVLIKKNVPVDIISLCDQMQKAGTLTDSGGETRIAQLINAVPSSMHAQQYAEIVLEMAQRRKMIEVASELARTAHRMDEDYHAGAVKAIDSLAPAAGAGGETVTLGEALSALYDQVHERMQSPRRVGLPTGLVDLDGLLHGGFEPGYNMLVGRPKIGKSKLAKQIAVAWAEANHPGAIFSMEMRAEAVVRRIASARSGVQTWKLKSGELDPEDIPAFINAVGELSDLPLYIDDTPMITVPQLRGKIAKLKARQGIEWFVLDYLLLMGGKGKSQDEEEFSQEVSRQIKAICQGENLVGLIINSVTKDQMGNVTPGLRTPRGSGQLIHDVDVMMVLTEHLAEKAAYSDSRLATLSVIANRDGNEGRIDLVRDPDFPVFHSVELRTMSSPSYGDVSHWSNDR